MKKVFAFLMIALIYSIGLFAQIKVATDNNVGIGVESPASKLSIGNTGNSSSKVYFENTTVSGPSIRTLQVYQPAPVYTTGNDWTYGILSSIQVSMTGYKHVGLYSSAYSSSALTGARTYGAMVYAGNAANGWNYGLYAGLLGSNTGAAIYAIVPGKTDAQIPGTYTYAAYLRGNVYVEDNTGLKETNPQYALDVNGTIRYVSLLQRSDIAYKKNITTLAQGNIQKIEQLRGVRYQLKTPEELGQVSVSAAASDTGFIEGPIRAYNPELYGKDQIGFIAQEIQKVFPELVEADSEGKLGVNYVGLIPVLVEALKEQQATINAMKAQIAVLNQKLKITAQ